MQILIAPPPYGALKKNFNATTSKINCLAWRNDDSHLLAAGYEYIYDWKIKEDHETKQKITQSNVTSVAFLEGNSIIAATDDMNMRKLLDNSNIYITEKFNYTMKELKLFSKSKLMACATSSMGMGVNEQSQNQMISSNTMNNGSKSTKPFTSCLRVFLDIKNKNDYIDIPAHHGETNRIRLNFDENYIFTCGSDGCINIYSVEIPMDAEEADKFLFEKISDNYTKTVLIRKLKLKERENEKKELPNKRDERLKKIKSENQEKREKLKKDLDEIKDKIVNTKNAEMTSLNLRKSDLESKELEYEKKIKTEKTLYNDTQEKQYSNNQIELAGKSREVEAIRENLRTHKNQHKEEISNTKKEFEEKRIHLEQEFLKEQSNLQNNKSELQEKIKSLEENKIRDNIALDWLNKKLADSLDQKIRDIKTSIEEMSVHCSHEVKKQIEELEKLKATSDSLKHDLKKIGEDRATQEKKKEVNGELKKKEDLEMKAITDRISDIENKIIECKKTHTYLEKCKFVLSYKIQELKKESGPMDKVLEDLQKRTKEDELSLNKYNREFEIINKKLVDLDDLKEKTTELDIMERTLKNEANNFKTDLFNMLADIDDYNALRDGFRNLRDKYLKNYVPETQDHELEGEFSNQKDNMKKRVNELQDNLKIKKKTHITNIRENREGNSSMIRKIAKLKGKIRKEKKKKETHRGDLKHANAFSAIRSGELVKRLVLEDIPIEQKILKMKDMIKKKKGELASLREIRDIPPRISAVEGNRNENIQSENSEIEDDDEREEESIEEEKS